MIVIVPHPPSINGLSLTPRESDIVFALSDGRSRSHDELADLLCFSGAADGIEDRSIDYHVRKLRRKLSAVGLTIVRGSGRGLRLAWLEKAASVAA